MMFGSVLEHFANLRYVKDAKLVFKPECTISGVPKLRSVHSSPLDPKMMFGSVSKHFAKPRHVKDEKLMFRA
jgi:hypothetical protein